MSDLGNKQIIAKNIKKYMHLNNKTRNEICNDLGIKYTTLSDWINAKKYPRIDKIEMLANYFGIEKSDLVEHKKNNQSYIWKNVKTAREKNNINQEELAALLDVPVELIKAIENNEKIPDYEFIVKLAKNLNCEISYLIFGENFRKYDISIIKKIDEIMSGNNESRKKLINLIVNLSDEDILFLEKALANLTKKVD